jgi:hypothetical protein
MLIAVMHDQIDLHPAPKANQLEWNATNHL